MRLGSSQRCPFDIVNTKLNPSTSRYSPQPVVVITLPIRKRASQSAVFAFGYSFGISSLTTANAALLLPPEPSWWAETPGSVCINLAWRAVNRPTLGSIRDDKPIVLSIKQSTRVTATHPYIGQYKYCPNRPIYFASTT